MNTIQDARDRAAKLVSGQRIRIKTNFINTVIGTVDVNQGHGISIFIEPNGTWQPIPFNSILKLEVLPAADARTRKQKTLEKLIETQDAFWIALGEAETEFGVDLDSSDDFSGLTVEDLENRKDELD